MLAAAAMGMQNAMMRLELAALPSTTVMTVNVTQSVIDVVTMLSRSAAAKREEARRRFSRMWPPLLAFTAGAASGAFGYALAGFTALLIPSALCLVLGALWGRAARRRCHVADRLWSCAGNIALRRWGPLPPQRKPPWPSRSVLGTLIGLTFGAGSAAQASDIDHVLLLSIDGLHALDVARYVENHPAPRWQAWRSTA